MSNILNTLKGHISSGVTSFFIASLLGYLWQNISNPQNTQSHNIKEKVLYALVFGVIVTTSWIIFLYIYIYKKDMNNKDINNKIRLQKLKILQIEHHEGDIFKSQNECMIWIDKIAPLLKNYDDNHYNNFIEHAKYLRNKRFSSDFLMQHLNSMLGIVNQAINELENREL